MHLLHLNVVWEKWKRLSHLIGSVMGRVWLTLLYFTLMVPFALFVRIAKDPFKSEKPPKWKSVDHVEESISNARMQG